MTEAIAIRKLLRIISALAVMVLATAPAYAQCAMCRAAVSASSKAGSLASGLNLAVLVLLVPPVAMFIGIFGMMYRSRNSSAGLQDEHDRVE